VLLGDTAVGKSCLVVRFVRDEFFEFQVRPKLSSENSFGWTKVALYSGMKVYGRIKSRRFERRGKRLMIRGAPRTPLPIRHLFFGTVHGRNPPLVLPS